MSNKIKDGGMHAKRVMGDIITYIFLIVLSVIWLIPFFWLVMRRGPVHLDLPAQGLHREQLQGAVHAV